MTIIYIMPCMAFFGVTIEEFETLHPHPNADRLLIAKLKNLGFQFIVPLGNWQPEDKCLYFPIDSILTEDLLTSMNLVGKLSGAKKNRVKTIKLRGQISMGLVAPLSLIENLSKDKWTSEEITRFLGITKYEPEINLPKELEGSLEALPNGISIYDIEGADRFQSVLQTLMNEPVWITEKLEGSHITCSAINATTNDGSNITEYVSQRRFTIIQKDDKEHMFWIAAKKQNLLEAAKNILKERNARIVNIRGEFVGPNVQSNIYRLLERKIYIFDIQIDGKYLRCDELIETLEKYNLFEYHVPILAKNVLLKDWLGDISVQEASNGKSVLFDTLREGIVIKPMAERLEPELAGRLILKQRSPEYLSNE